MDSLTQGSHIGAMSCLIEQPYAYYFRAVGSVRVHLMAKKTLEEYRELLPDLDDSIAEIEKRLQSEGTPTIDYSDYSSRFSYDDSCFKKFQRAVRRAVVLNEQKKKKTLKLTKLIQDLRRNNAIEERKEEQKKEKKRVQEDISKSILSRIKESLDPHMEGHKVVIDMFKMMHSKSDGGLMGLGQINELGATIAKQSSTISKLEENIIYMRYLLNKHGILEMEDLSIDSSLQSDALKKQESRVKEGKLDLLLKQTEEVTTLINAFRLSNR